MIIGCFWPNSVRILSTEDSYAAWNSSVFPISTAFCHVRSFRKSNDPTPFASPMPHPSIRFRLRRGEFESLTRSLEAEHEITDSTASATDDGLPRRGLHASNTANQLN